MSEESIPPARSLRDGRAVRFATGNAFEVQDHIRSCAGHFQLDAVVPVVLGTLRFGYPMPSVLNCDQLGMVLVGVWSGHLLYSRDIPSNESAVGIEHLVIELLLGQIVPLLVDRDRVPLLGGTEHPAVELPSMLERPVLHDLGRVIHVAWVIKCEMGLIHQSNQVVVLEGHPIRQILPQPVLGAHFRIDTASPRTVTTAQILKTMNHLMGQHAVRRFVHTGRGRRQSPDVSISAAECRSSWTADHQDDQLVLVADGLAFHNQLEIIDVGAVIPFAFAEHTLDIEGLVRVGVLQWVIAIFLAPEDGDVATLYTSLEAELTVGVVIVIDPPAARRRLGQRQLLSHCCVNRLHHGEGESEQYCEGC